VSRSRLTHALDWLALAVVVVTVSIVLTGGFTFRIGGSKLTARNPYRPALLVLALVLTRAALDRQTPPFAQARAIGRWVRDRVYDPAADPPIADTPHSAFSTQHSLLNGRHRGYAFAGFCGFAVLFLYPQMLAMDSVPDMGDPLFSIWRTGWVYHKLFGDPRPLFSPNIFHPTPLTLTYSDSMLLPSLTTIPWLMVGLRPVVAYNVVMILSFIASAFAAYLLVERLTSSPLAAFIAGVLFGFYPYRFEHYSHYELQMTYCMPLALLALHRLVNEGRVRHGVVFGLLAAAQLYCSMYYAVFFLWYTAIVLVMLCLLTRPPIRRLVVPVAVAGVLAAVLAFPLFRTYKAAHLGDRESEVVAYYSATVGDYFRAHHRSATWGTRMLPGRRPERALFPGAVALLLTVLALVPPLGITRVTYAAALAVMFDISRGYNGFVYPFLYEWLPFMRGLRVPARASILVGMTLTILAGFAVRRLIANLPRQWSRAVFAGLLVVIAIDLRPLLPLERLWPEPPPVYSWIANPRRTVLAEFPMSSTIGMRFADTPQMYFSLWHWAQLVNGYSGHSPATFPDFLNALRMFPQPETIDLLRTQGTTHVSINCALYRDVDRCGRTIAIIEQLPMFHLIASGRWQGQPVRMYELR
jgi:hypothetical protein